MLASDEGYYLVHGCRTIKVHEDGCSGVFFWARSANEAKRRGVKEQDLPESWKAVRQKQADRYRDALGSSFGTGIEKVGLDSDRALRFLGFAEDSDGICSLCGLYEFFRLIESTVCVGCDQCRECGCMCDVWERDEEE